MSFVFSSLPVNAPLRVTSPFGKRDTGIQGASTMHIGVDLGRDFSKPKTEILAVADGRIAANYWNDYRGWVVLVEHNGTYSTLYQHLSSQCPLVVGVKVKAGQVLGIMGNSSNKKALRVAVHLHFELRKNGVAVDPLPYLKNIQKEVENLTEAEVKKIVAATISEMLDGNGSAPSDWAKVFWNNMTKAGIVDGSRPKGYTTREEVAAMLSKAFAKK